MATERAFFAQPVPGAGGRVIASPFQFVTTGEDSLRITSVNSLVGVRVKVQARRLDSGGDIKASAWDHTPASDRTAVMTDIELGSGALLNLTVFASAGAPRVGQTFVIVQLIRGTGAVAIVLGTLLQGYITSTQGLGWPGSPIQSSIEAGGCVRVLTGTVPGVGLDCVETVPTGARWELLNMFSQIATSVAGGTRVPYFFTISGGQYVTFGVQANGAPPSETHAFTWGPNYPLNDDIPHHHHQQAFPSPMILLAGDTFGTLTLALTPTDQWEALRYRVREWLEVT